MTRHAVLVDGSVSITVPEPSLRRTAHVAGNQVDVMHCFGGDERYLTPEGLKTFVETAGTTQKVLTSSGDVHDGEWVEAPIRYYGDQEIWELTVARNKRTKTIRTTAGHRWLVGRPGKWSNVVTSDLRSGHRLAYLLLSQRHRESFEAVPHGTDPVGWTVQSVRSTGEVEPVYCAEVPGTESFTLEDNIWTGNCPFCGSGAVVARSDMSIQCDFCQSAFTVTVSPVFPAFPMSMNGQPYPWPGRPADGGDPSMMGGDPTMQGNDGFGGSLIPGGGTGGADDEDGDDGGNPFADGDDSDGDDDDSDTEAEVGGSKKPPFGKKSSSRMYRTASGATLSRADYERHLAIATANDPDRAITQVRASWGRRR